MKRIIVNTVSEKVLGIFTDAEFVHKVREIAVENGDEELSITVVAEAVSYVAEYCDNLIDSLCYVDYSDVKEVVEKLKMSYTDEMGEFILLNYYTRDYNETETWVSIFESLAYEWQETNITKEDIESIQTQHGRLVGKILMTFNYLSNRLYEFFSGNDLTDEDEETWEHGSYEVRSYTASGFYYVYDVRILRVDEKGIYISKVVVEPGDKKTYYIKFTDLSSIAEQIRLLEAMVTLKNKK